MARSALLGIALAAALFTPRSVDAQLATWCSNLDPTKCFSVVDYLVSVTDDQPVSYAFTPRVEGFLTGLPTDLTYQVFLTLDYQTISAEPFNVTLLQTCSGDGSPCVLEELMELTPEAFGVIPVSLATLDVSLLRVREFDGLRPRDKAADISCSPNGMHPTVQPCVSVPEPESFALLGTGLLLMGFVGWRRRREA